MDELRRDEHRPYYVFYMAVKELLRICHKLKAKIVALLLGYIEQCQVSGFKAVQECFASPFGKSWGTRLPICFYYVVTTNSIDRLEE